jgi:hypothetical protein
MEGRRATHAYLAQLVSAATIVGYELPAFA